jgi:hypothetical protein
MPPLNDSLRTLAKDRMNAEARSEAAGREIETVASGWRAGRDVRTLARSAGATVETLTVYRDSLADAILPMGALDSLFLAGAERMVRGPRRLGTESVLWRADAIDTSYVRSYESARAKVEQAVAQEKRTRTRRPGASGTTPTRPTTRPRQSSTSTTWR